MGIRGAVKSGGGFWNNVDGVFASYEFTTTPPGEQKKGKKGADEWVYFVPSVQIDGADDETSQHLFVGGVERYTISDDGQELSDADGGNVSIGATTPAGKFLISVLDAEPELEGEFPDVEGGEPLNFNALVGRRIRLKQEVDVEGTKKRGKRKVVTKGGKTVEYDRTDTIVIAVYPADAKAGKGGKATAGKPAGKSGGKEKADPIRDKADKAVLDLMEAAVTKKNPNGTIPTSSLSVGVLKALSSDSDKSKVRTLVLDDAYVTGAAERGIFQYDEKEEEVSLND